MGGVQGRIESGYIAEQTLDLSSIVVYGSAAMLAENYRLQVMVKSRAAEKCLIVTGQQPLQGVAHVDGHEWIDCQLAGALRGVGQADFLDPAIEVQRDEHCHFAPDLVVLGFKADLPEVEGHPIFLLRA